MVAANLKMQEIPVAVTRADVVREMRRMLDKKIAKTMQQLRKYENDGNEEMANCMDWYAEGMEYALACILSLDEEYKKAYTVKIGGE